MGCCDYPNVVDCSKCREWLDLVNSIKSPRVLSAELKHFIRGKNEKNN